MKTNLTPFPGLFHPGDIWVMGSTAYKCISTTKFDELGIIKTLKIKRTKESKKAKKNKRKRKQKRD